MSLNLLTNKIYGKNFWEKFKGFCNRIKWSWQRITKGYCDFDTWDLEYYYLELMIKTLEQYRNNLHGGPIKYFNLETGSAEPWAEHLDKIIHKLRFAAEDRDKLNKYKYDWCEQGGADLDDINFNDEYFDLYSEEDMKIYLKQKEVLKEALMMLAEDWYDLWD